MPMPMPMPQKTHQQMCQETKHPNQFPKKLNENKTE